MGKNRKKKNATGTGRVLVAVEVPCTIVSQLKAYYFGQDRDPNIANNSKLVCNRVDLSQHWERA